MSVAGRYQRQPPTQQALEHDRQYMHLARPALTAGLLLLT
jgi:hypothetical protein